MIRIMRLMSQKLRDVESVASGLALCDVEERLRQTLVRLAKRQGRHSRGRRLIRAGADTVGAGPDGRLAARPSRHAQPDGSQRVAERAAGWSSATR
jgi:CRP-like cAMP-binding protein